MRAGRQVYRLRISYSDAQYFRLSENDNADRQSGARTARADTATNPRPETLASYLSAVFS
jgi:hypothetical protein